MFVIAVVIIIFTPQTRFVFFSRPEFSSPCSSSRSTLNWIEHRNSLLSSFRLQHVPWPILSTLPISAQPLAIIQTHGQPRNAYHPMHTDNCFLNNWLAFSCFLQVFHFFGFCFSNASFDWVCFPSWLYGIYNEYLIALPIFHLNSIN